MIAAGSSTVLRIVFLDDRSHLEIKIPGVAPGVPEDFWIDQIPGPSNLSQCVADGNCNPPHYRNYFLKYYTSPFYHGAL
jgi:hypothetical protein